MSKQLKDGATVVRDKKANAYRTRITGGSPNDPVGLNIPQDRATFDVHIWTKEQPTKEQEVRLGQALAQEIMSYIADVDDHGSDLDSIPDLMALMGGDDSDSDYEG